VIGNGHNDVLALQAAALGRFVLGGLGSNRGDEARPEPPVRLMASTELQRTVEADDVD
jgi:hypothetical protein